MTRCLSTMGLLTLLILTVLDTCSAQNMKVDVEDLINSLDNGPKQIPVALNWGIPDSSAVVGRVFNYAIPSDAFKGDIISYMVSEDLIFNAPYILNNFFIK